jgi:hypothetical protein
MCIDTADQMFRRGEAVITTTTTTIVKIEYHLGCLHECMLASLLLSSPLTGGIPIAGYEASVLYISYLIHIRTEVSLHPRQQQTPLHTLHPEKKVAQPDTRQLKARERAEGRSVPDT